LEVIPPVCLWITTY